MQASVEATLVPSAMLRGRVDSGPAKLVGYIKEDALLGHVRQETVLTIPACMILNKEMCNCRQHGCLENVQLEYEFNEDTLRIDSSDILALWIEVDCAALSSFFYEDDEDEEEEQGMDETAFREWLYEDRPYDSAGIRELLRNEYGIEAKATSFDELVEELILADVESKEK